MNSPSTLTSPASNPSNDCYHQRDELMRQRDELMRQRDELMRQRNELMRERDHLVLERNAMSLGFDDPLAARPRDDDPIPGILFNTRPKSASVFILETLATTLDKPIVKISPGYFPCDHVDFRRLNALVQNKLIAQSHLDASIFNKKFLRLIDKVIIQFRHPCQATLSWLHHLDRLNKQEEHDLLLTVTPKLPRDYFSRDFPDKIDYLITYYLPQVVKWMTDWLNYVDGHNDTGRFMITTYETFMADPTQYFFELLTFLGCVSPDMIDVFQVAPSTDKNFRKGLTDEWKTVFTTSQADHATETIPEFLRTRFGW